MNVLLVLAGALALMTTGVHVIAGGRIELRRVLAAELDPVPKKLMHACWHLVTVDLSVAGAVLVAAGIADSKAWRLVAGVIAAHFALYGVVFLAVTLTAGWQRPLFKLPQWTLMLPIAGLAVGGAAISG